MIFYEDRQFRYSKRFFGRHVILNKATGTSLKATEEELRRLRDILIATTRVPWPARILRRTVEANIYRAFCLTVHGDEKIWPLFMTQEPSIAALTFGMIEPDV